MRKLVLFIFFVSFLKISAQEYRDFVNSGNMLDLGSLGYNRRIVEVTKLTFFIRYVEPIDTSMISAPWIKANKQINELKLKGG
nr:hypothetical protein [uncultured Carboxylicivirga sp.]